MTLNSVYTKIRTPSADDHLFLFFHVIDTRILGTLGKNPRDEPPLKGVRHIAFCNLHSI